MTKIEQANGTAYTHGSVTILFPYGLPPKLLFFDRWVSIMEPERFGPWATNSERIAYVKAFTARGVIREKLA